MQRSSPCPPGRKEFGAGMFAVPIALTVISQYFMVALMRTHVGASSNFERDAVGVRAALATRFLDFSAEVSPPGSWKCTP
jgi:hypothetical protein